MSRAPRRRQGPETTTCIKFSLFFINVVFWLIGSILLALGIYVLVETKDLYKELADLAFQPSIIFFIVGAIIFIITFIGCLGALRENTCLLGTYSIILTVILLLVLSCGVVGFVYKDSVESKLISSLKKAIVFYRDAKREDLQNLIDLTQIELQCCGAISYDDWDANRYFNCSAPSGSAESCGVPYSCCLADLQLNRQCGYGIRKPGVTLATKKKSINTMGCVEQGKFWFGNNLILMGSICVVTLVLQLISVFLANKLREEVKEIKSMRK